MTKKSRQKFNINILYLEHEKSFQVETLFSFLPNKTSWACLQSPHSIKWQESSQSRSSHHNSRVEERESLTSF